MKSWLNGLNELNEFKEEDGESEVWRSEEECGVVNFAETRLKDKHHAWCLHVLWGRALHIVYVAMVFKKQNHVLIDLYSTG